MNDDFLKSYPRAHQALDAAELLFSVSGSVPVENVEASFAYYRGVWTESARLIHDNIDRPDWEKDCLIACTFLGVLNDTVMHLPYVKNKFGNDVAMTLADIYRFHENDVPGTNVSQILLAAQITAHHMVFNVIEGKQDMMQRLDEFKAGVTRMAAADHSNLLANAEAPQLEVLYHKSMKRLKQELQGPLFKGPPAPPPSPNPSPQGQKP